MSARIQPHGRAALIREVLTAFPAGATTAEIKVAGEMPESLKVIGTSLIHMRESDQVVMSMGDNCIRWTLTPKIRQAMARIKSLATSQARVASRPAPAHSRASDGATTIRHKEKDRAELERLIAAFQKAGGKIQVLSNTPLKSLLNRRQVVEGGIERRAVRGGAK